MGSDDRTIARARDDEIFDAQQFLYDSPYVTIDDDTYEFVLECFPPGRPILAGIMDLTSRIYRDFTYEGGVTDVSTPVNDVLMTRKGVCQDFAHLEIAALRSLGTACSVYQRLSLNPSSGRTGKTGWG